MSDGLERKRNMAILTPQFKIKHGLEQGEFMRVVYQPSIKTPRAREMVRHFLLVEIVLNGTIFRWRRLVL